MAWHEDPKVTQWPELRDALHLLGESDRLACRGQSKDYDGGALYSTIDRSLRQAGLTDDLARTVERVSIQRFLQAAPNYLPPSELHHLGDGPSLLMLMRHYGGPTRLLDWTESIWVAAFAAANGSWESDGVIWVFDRQSFDGWAHRRYGHETPHAGLTAIWSGTPLPAVTLLRLKPWICRLFGVGPRIPRVIAQQGMFTIGSQLGLDHAKLVDGILPDGTPNSTKRVIRIDRSLKPRILKELARMGLTASSLFPGIDGLGRSVETFVHFAGMDQGVRMLAEAGVGALQTTRRSSEGRERSSRAARKKSRKPSR